MLNYLNLEIKVLKKPMFTKLFNHFSAKLALFLILLLAANQCGLYKKTDSRKVSVNGKEKGKKNLEEGRRIKFGQLTGKGSGNFEFASSNEMWRATVDILDFMPLANADYGGGVIITDWYSDNSQKNDSIKISIRFLTNEVRADALNIKIFKKNCETIEKILTFFEILFRSRRKGFFSLTLANNFGELSPCTFAGASLAWVQWVHLHPRFLKTAFFYLY